MWCKQGDNSMAWTCQTIFDSNINELTEIQKVSFKNLLLQFQDSSNDIYRTEMIERTINTGQAPPCETAHSPGTSLRNTGGWSWNWKDGRTRNYWSQY